MSNKKLGIYLLCFGVGIFLIGLLLGLNIYFYYYFAIILYVFSSIGIILGIVFLIKAGKEKHTRYKQFYDKCKIFLWVLISTLIMGGISFAASFIPPNNTYFEADISISQNNGIKYDQYSVGIKIQNLTDKTLTIDFEIVSTDDSNYDSRSETYTVTVLPNENKRIDKNGTHSIDERIYKVRFYINGQIYDYNTDGLMTFNLLLIVTAAVIIILSIAFLIIDITEIVKQRHYDKSRYISSRPYSSVQSPQFQNETYNTNDAEQERLKNEAELQRLKIEKSQLENEIAKVWVCKYCGAKNFGGSAKCPNCGSSR